MPFAARAENASAACFPNRARSASSSRDSASTLRPSLSSRRRFMRRCGSSTASSKSSPRTSTPVSRRRNTASAPAKSSASGCACACAKARAKSGAGTKLRRSALGSDRIIAAALSSKKPGASQVSRAGSSALSRCSGTATVMPSSTAPGSKRYCTSSLASPSAITGGNLAASLSSPTSRSSRLHSSARCVFFWALRYQASSERASTMSEGIRWPYQSAIQSSSTTSPTRRCLASSSRACSSVATLRARNGLRRLTSPIARPSRRKIARASAGYRRP